MDELRDQVSLLLSQHHANQTRYENTTQVAQLEVVVLLESPGGGASDYGLAAQQLLRLRKEPGIKLTVCVDKVAASGGYMMAATAHEILAAPFAVIGSIGVYGQAINIHDVLESWRVRDLVFRAGRNKAPLGLLGEVTQDGKETIQSMIDATHIAFKRHIVTARPSLEGAIDDIATGDVWLGYNALGKGLIDRLVTSDEYLGERIRQGARVLKLVKYRKPFFLGPRTSSEYSMASIVKALMAELKAFLLNDESPANLNARSFTANTVQTKSQIL
jgi:serine protease SohB